LPKGFFNVESDCYNSVGKSIHDPKKNRP